MSWEIRRTTLLAVLACGVFSVMACDLDDGEDDDDVPIRTSSSGGSSGSSTTGGGSRGSNTANPTSSTSTSTGRPGSSTSTSGPTPSTSDGSAGRGDGPIVAVEQGQLRGRIVEHDVRAFLGVPYAEPPVSDLRWAAPMPARAWSGTRDAGTYADRCAQSASELYGNDESLSEDCLYLNIWAPNVSGTTRLPVLFWIHGGLHHFGSSSDPAPAGRAEYYDGSALAARGYVVVSVNYRLGAFGFFAHDSLKKERSPFGNQGLWDQVAALTWVQDNIEHFGGEPKNVTIFGQDSGASDVCMHVLSPESRGLFRQAISQSGSCTTYQAQPADVANEIADWIAEIGCDEAKDVLACLRDAPVRVVLDAAELTPTAFTAIIDGVFLPDQPRRLYERPSHDLVPYLLGSNTDEGAWFSDEFASVTTVDAHHAFLVQRFPTVPADELCELYPHDEFGTTPAALQRSLARVFADAFVTCPLADTALRASRAGSAVYAYHFDVAADNNEVGPYHGAEIGYVFGSDARLSKNQRKVSELLQGYWTGFARDGYPDRDQALPQWPEFKRPDELRLQFTLGVTRVSTFPQKECAFWSKVYDSRFAQPR